MFGILPLRAAPLPEGVFFAREGDIWFMEPDGSHARPLAQTALREEFPVCAPNGQWVVYQVYDGGRRQYDLWVMRSNGTGARTLVRNARHPAWSPTGEWIAFDRPYQGARETVDIWAVRSDGTHLRRWTSHPEVDLFPTWSPWGDALAFVRTHATRDRQGRLTGLSSQIIMRTWEGNERIVLKQAQAYVVGLAWSINDELCFGLRPLRSDRTQHLWRVRLDGNGLQRLSPPGLGLESTPTWSPDGRWLAFVRFDPKGGRVWRMRADGAFRTALSVGDVNDQTVSWFQGSDRVPIQTWQGSRRRYWVPLPTLRDGELWVPLRELARAWNWEIRGGSDRKIHLLDRQQLRLTLSTDQPQAQVEDRALVLSAPPFRLHDDWMVPLSSLAKGMGWSVVWDPERRVLRIPERPD